VRETVPVNPPDGVIVMVEVADWPAFRAAGDVALMAKLAPVTKVKVAVAVCVREPLVPVIVTANAFAVVELQVRVALPDPVTLLGVIAPQVSPAGTVLVRETIPAKPFRPVIVIVEVPDAGRVAVGDVAVIVKSTKLNVAVVE
jgi:hypothetical protein